MKTWKWCSVGVYVSRTRSLVMFLSPHSSPGSWYKTFSCGALSVSVPSGYRNEEYYEWGYRENEVHVSYSLHIFFWVLLGFRDTASMATLCGHLRLRLLKFSSGLHRVHPSGYAKGKKSWLSLGCCVTFVISLKCCVAVQIWSMH